MSNNVICIRDAFTIFDRWAKRCPVDALNDKDPRGGGVCTSCETTFAWRGYHGRCGWCFEEAEQTETGAL